ncbi:MAG: response regulator transcription factor [SAR202 cluster bacterium]|nr:response regulator transcription factor [SAR202 cluster bacterium]
MAIETLRGAFQHRVLLLTDRLGRNRSLVQSIGNDGLGCVPHFGLEGLAEGLRDEAVDAVVVDLEAWRPEEVRGLIGSFREAKLPVLGVVGERGMEELGLELDDVVLRPLRPGEMKYRVERATARLQRAKGPKVMTRGELVIDQERYEVSVGGRKTLLTYKEYQLLVLLASAPGRVFGREALLAKIWGYDYFGGTRTVDVHIRRLRAKIEEGAETYIETVRNVGYRFKA